MKRIFLSCIFHVVRGFAAAQQLPELAVPENCQISFAPDFQKTISRRETIKVWAQVHLSIVRFSRDQFRRGHRFNRRHDADGERRTR